MKEEGWKIKIVGFLYSFSKISYLNQSKAIKQELECLLKKISPSVSDEVARMIENADQIAYALDVPPFLPLKNGGSFFINKPILKHPLAGNEKILEGLDLKNQMLETAIAQAINEINRYYDGNNEKFFLTLWRCLPEVVRKKCEELNVDAMLYELLDLLPADPRVPDHTIWDHASMSSATVSALPKPALLIFNIASAQDFITKARRTQDLWAGSYLLSYFTWEAMKSIIEKYGPDCIIYPNLREQPLVDYWLKLEKGINFDINRADLLKEIASFPNNFTALIPEGEAENTVKEAQQAILNARDKIMNCIKSYVEQSNLGKDKYWDEIWERQKKDFLKNEIFWVIYNIGENNQMNINKIIENYYDLLEKDDQIDKLLSFVRNRGFEINLGMVYPLLSRLAGRAHTARKNLRNFDQVEELGHRCSLCGIREALHPNKIGLRQFWEKLASESRNVKLRGRIRKGEKLCAICLTKRLVSQVYFSNNEKIKYPVIDYHMFPSTSSIAAVTFKKKILEKILENKISEKNNLELKNELKNYVNSIYNFLIKYDILYKSSPIPYLEVLKEKFLDNDKQVVEKFLEIDGEWLYEESISCEKIEREYGIKIKDKREVENLKKALENFLEKSKKFGLKPSKYYAIIAMDGDSISDWLSGKNAPKLSEIIHPSIELEKELKEIKRPLGPALHISLSTAMRNFALSITKRVVEERYYGKLIYAGGDDVLAFLPLEDLLNVIRELRLLYSGDNFKDGGINSGGGYVAIGNRTYMMMGEKASTSAGIVIAHYSHPFSHIAEEVHQVLKEEAKKVKDKDAFAIYLLKRAGEPLQTVSKWKYNGMDVIKTIIEVKNCLLNDYISSRLLYIIKDEKLGMEGLSIDAKKGELERLINRHSKDVEEVKSIKENLLNLLNGIDNYEKEGSWEKIANLLLLSRFIAMEA
jgi:CRISPR-associated protein Cmr2